jgi:hypothetical protein
MAEIPGKEMRQEAGEDQRPQESLMLSKEDKDLAGSIMVITLAVCIPVAILVNQLARGHSGNAWRWLTDRLRRQIA